MDNEQPRDDGFEDEVRKCRDCGLQYVWEAGERAFFARNLLKPPRRCAACRVKKKQLITD